MQGLHIRGIVVHKTEPRRSDVFTGVVDFSGLSLIKLKKEEMEAQVSGFLFSSPRVMKLQRCFGKMFFLSDGIQRVWLRVVFRVWQ